MSSASMSSASVETMKRVRCLIADRRSSLGRSSQPMVVAAPGQNPGPAAGPVSPARRPGARPRGPRRRRPRPWSACRRRRAPRDRSARRSTCMSASTRPWVVTAGVPTRMPEDTIGGCGSYGMAFLLSVIRAASHRASASAPVTPTPCRSMSARWVSVPPLTGRMPSAASPAASACALRDDLARVLLVLRASTASRSATALAATACISGPPCMNGKTALSILAACSSRQTIMPPRGPRSTLCVVKQTTSAYGTGLGIALPATRPMKCAASTIRIRADLVGDLPERREVDQPRVGRGAADDHLRPVLVGEVAHLVVVDQLGVLAHAVRHGVEPLAGEVDLRPVGQVAAVRQRHRQHRVAGHEEGRVRGEVGAGARVRLQVGVLGAEELLGPRDADQLGLVDLGAAAVVATARVALGVLVGQRASRARRARPGW